VPEKEGACRHRATVSASKSMIDRKSIAAAALRIAAHVRHTPLLSADLGGASPVTLKLELLQCAGSFKPRGAFNRLLSAGILFGAPLLSASPPADRRLSAAQLPSAGVLAASGGNHGAAVAYAAHRLGIRAEIFVPVSTPAAKVARIAGYGAKVVQVGRTYADALAASRIRGAETAALEVHAYDDPDVLAGQGTVGREFEQDAPELTHILVATGGGGLIGGIAAWYAGSVQVVSVEPESCPALHEALRVGHPVEAPVGGLAADSLGAKQVGTLMFPIAQRFVNQTVLVTDEAILAAQRVLWDRFRLVAEPGGATAVAALLSGRFVPPSAARVGVVLCGSNTDPTKVI
jgi:threonine dehydratase